MTGNGRTGFQRLSPNVVLLCLTVLVCFFVAAYAYRWQIPVSDEAMRVNRFTGEVQYLGDDGAWSPATNKRAGR